MNEVNKIHLGRQAFTIAADAHHELQKYLEAIKKHVKDADVLNEIEMRMAELLVERGLNEQKVVLLSDVEYLKEQLGAPNDFDESADDSEIPDTQPTGKRLFRDPENAYLAGVAAGLGKYFGIDIVIVRVVFVLLTIFTGGWGAALYGVLWLLTPEAKTPSDRLQMVGKPVTVENLKEIVEKADIKGKADQTTTAAGKFINSFLRVSLKVIGIGFILIGLTALFGLVAAGVYFFLHHNNWGAYNIFPIGLKEHVLLYIGMGIAALMGLFVIVFGTALYRRKWPIPVWGTGILVGLVFISMAAGTALSADVYPQVRNRYNSNLHNTVRTVEPFTSIDIDSSDADVNLAVSDRYYVDINYYDHPDLNGIKTTVKDGVLRIDTRDFNRHRDCNVACIPDVYNVRITVHSPNPQDLRPVRPDLPLLEMN